MSSAPGIAVIGHRSMIGKRLVECIPDKTWHPLHCDITDYASTFGAIGSTDAPTILNCAAFTDLNAAWEQVNRTDQPCHLVNAVGAMNAANACRKLDRRLVHLSTEYVFSGDKSDPYTEDDPTDTSDWYGKTKALGEALCQEATEDLVIIRLATPFQAQSDRKLDIARKILARLTKGDPVSMFADTVITPTWTDDIATALQALLKWSSRGIYHVAGATSLSPYAFAIAIANEFQLPQELVQPSTLDDYLLQNKRPYARNLAVSINKLQRDTDIRTLSCADALHAVRCQMETPQ